MNVPYEYSKRERKALNRAFTAALQHLSETHLDSETECEFICHALSKAETFGKISYPDEMRAKGLIMWRLGGNVDLTNWLIDQGMDSKAIKTDRSRMGLKAQAARKAWLESLIEEFSS